MSSTEAGTTGRDRFRAVVSRWPRWTGPVAAAVLGCYALAAAAWYFGGPYVFAAPGNPENNFEQHWLADLPAGAVQAVMLAGGAAVVAAVWAMRVGPRGPLRPVLLSVGFAAAAFLALVFPGPLSLDTIPVFNLVNVARLDWVTVHLVLLAYTGAALAAATLAYARAARDACVHCGRSGGPEWSRRRWARIGTATAIAGALAPLGYAVSRICWSFGVPLGTTEEHLVMMAANYEGNELMVLELTLASMALGGALLCFGLSRPWSRTWPRWVVGLAGGPVPRWFPIGAAVACGVGLTGFGTALSPALLGLFSGETVYRPGTDVPMTSVSYIPAVSLTVWGPLVLVAAAAFHFRTRGRCRWCGRGTRGEGPGSSPRAVSRSV